MFTRAVIITVCDTVFVYIRHVVGKIHEICDYPFCNDSAGLTYTSGNLDRNGLETIIKQKGETSPPLLDCNIFDVPNDARASRVVCRVRYRKRP